MLSLRGVERFCWGFRAIEPYKNVWALPGGRILKHEYPSQAVRRNLAEIGVTARIRSLVGVFPVMFPRHPQKRYDITLCYKASWVSGEPKPGRELHALKWFSPSKIPKSTGANYKKMVQEVLRQSEARSIERAKSH
jgi:ADP-ribose pyrophosphatase YjhB (NUDIX family)